jgi:hypothetical protein
LSTEDNPYAPPKSAVSDVAKVEGASQAEAPPLWNPGAAFAWSLLLSPAMGAFLQMRNWQALGEPQKAAASRAWFIGVIVAVVVVSTASVFVPALDAATRFFGLPLTAAWYFGNGRAQVEYVKERFGTTYPRKRWGAPILITIGITAVYLILFVVTMTMIGAATGMEFAD